MNKLISGLLSCFAVVLLMVPMAHAQTPDGQTPAEETVCDPLKADGTTKGLYGLCVALCEAQDQADPYVPMTDEEYAALEKGNPSGAILAAYNRKRDKADNGIDPPMPCVVIEEEEQCPCWTSAELAAATPPNSDYDNNYPNACNEGSITLIEDYSNLPALFQIGASSVFSNCFFVSDGFPDLRNNINIQVDPTQLEACQQSIRNYANSNQNRIDGERWDCF